MKLLIVAAVAALALASRSSWTPERPWQAKNEYRYKYEASIFTGIPIQNTEVSLTRGNAEVIVQVLILFLKKPLF